MKNIKYIALIIFVLTSHLLVAQDDLLDELEGESEEVSFNYPAFKAMKIANLQSTKVADGGDTYMYVSHRFGTIKDGFDTFFGLDNANTKIQLVYGIVDGLQIGLSRESFRKTYAGSLKAKLINQTNKSPLTVTFFGTVNLNSQIQTTSNPLLKYADRFSYASQFLISRRFSNSFSFEIAPTYVRQNLTYETGQKNNQFALGLGGRYKLSKRMSFNFDYVYNLSRLKNSAFNNPLSIGIDIETGGHVFQLLFANSQSTNEPSFISNAGGDWSKGDIFFGFNIVRVF